MKRDKITFAFFLIPIFLFSGSLKYFSFDKGKNPNSSLTQQQIKSIKEGLPFHSKRSHHVQDRALVNSKTTLAEKPREATRSTYQPRKIKRILPACSRDFLSNRAKRPNPSRFRQQIKYLNKGQPFRPQGKLYAPDQVLVKFKSTLSEQMIKATIEAYQSRKLKRIPRIGIYQIQIPEDVTLEEMLFMLRRNPDVEYAEPNYIAYLAAIPEEPNDLFFSEQYALYNSGQEFGSEENPQRGKSGADIKAISAWKETKGDEDVIIAVIDTGVDFEHPDIKNKIHPGGYNFGDDDSDATDDLYHGTLVAGIVAAETDNSEGIAGVAWNCKILPLKIMDDQGNIYYSYVIDAIIYAADLDENNDNIADVKVINISLGGDSLDPFLEAALKYAYDKNIVIVAAAGNYDPLWGSDVQYPAAYDDYCLAVAATDYNDLRPDWSNYGPQVDVAAPGYAIISLVPRWFPATQPEWDPDIYYAYGDGTSMAVPHVAGLAALIKSIKPWLTNAEIMNVIRYTADDINSASNPGKDEFIGYGRINMDKALVPIEIKPSK